MKEYNTNGRVLHNVAGSFYTGNPNSEQRRFPLNRTGVWTSTGLHSQSRSSRINSCFVDMQKKAPVSLGKKTLCLTLSVVVLSRWPRKPSSDHSRPPRGVWILDGYHGLWQIIVVLFNRFFVRPIGQVEDGQRASVEFGENHVIPSAGSPAHDVRWYSKSCTRSSSNL
jgi:hypothetical protein